MVGAEFTFTNDKRERSRWEIISEKFVEDGSYRALTKCVKCKNPEGIGYQSIFKAEEIMYDPVTIATPFIFD